MEKQQFNSLAVLEQLTYINNLLAESKSLREIGSILGMSKTTFRDRFKKIGYIYMAKIKQYGKDNTIKKQSVIQNNNNRISEVLTVTNQENNNQISRKEYEELRISIAEIKEILGMKDQINEAINYYSKSKDVVPEQQELKIDNEKFDGGLNSRLIKVHGNVNYAWIIFCKSYSQFKMQDLYSIALMEFMQKYKKS